MPISNKTFAPPAGQNELTTAGPFAPELRDSPPAPSRYSSTCPKPAPAPRPRSVPAPPALNCSEPFEDNVPEQVPCLDYVPAQPPPPLPPAPAQLLQTTAWLTIFSIFGALARLGLSALTTYPGAPLPGLPWANFGGCLVLGFLTASQTLFTPRGSTSEKPIATKATLPLYVGLATGFCGSFTSLSSLMLAAFDQLANVSPAHVGRPTKGYNFLAVVAYVVAELAVSVAGLQTGRHVAGVFEGVSLPRRVLRPPTLSVVALAVGMWAGAAVVTALIPRWRADALFACCFAPLGCYARFWVSKWLNPKVKTFPIGTFAVNICGTAVLGALAIGRYEIGGEVGCGLLIGAADGFCGCLTTVSTFVNEFTAMRGEYSVPRGPWKGADVPVKHAYRYAVMTVIAGLLVIIVVLGSYVGRP